MLKHWEEARRSHATELGEKTTGAPPLSLWRCCRTPRCGWRITAPALELALIAQSLEII
jgi:hypothetical protein